MKMWLKKTLLVLLIAVLTVAAIGIFCWRNTDIPKLYLEGDISQMLDKSDARSISFRYEGKEETWEGFAEIKIQGSSSIAFDKKNYTLKFYEDADHEHKMKIDVGWGPQNKYCMKANWIDRTHARNVVSAKLAGKMQAQYGLLEEAPNNGAIDGFPVEIYSNGKFLGLYTFNIPKDEWQFAMDGDNPDHIVICGEYFNPPGRFLAMPDYENWSVEVGDQDDATMEKMERLFAFVLNSSDEEFRTEFEEYLDLDSALNYYVFADLAHLRDNLGRNMLIATYDSQKWYLSLYDLDSSWGTNVDGLSLYPYEENLLDMAYNNLFARMEQNFPEELAQRYFELRAGILSNESILAEFEAFREQIPELSYLKDTIRWGKGFIRRPEELPGYDFAQIKAYLDSVSPRLDEKYTAMLGE